MYGYPSSVDSKQQSSPQSGITTQARKINLIQVIIHYDSSSNQEEIISTDKIRKRHGNHTVGARCKMGANRGGKLENGSQGMQ